MPTYEELEQCRKAPTSLDKTAYFVVIKDRLLRFESKEELIAFMKSQIDCNPLKVVSSVRFSDLTSDNRNLDMIIIKGENIKPTIKKEISITVP